MKGITKAAKQADGRSRVCATCPIHRRDKICSPEVMRVCSDAFMEGFKKGVKWSKTQSAWISVKEELPEKSKIVLTGCWCTDYFKYMQRGLYNKENAVWQDDCGDEICVTHWMPIEKPID